MREYEIKPYLQKILNKLFKKDKVAYEAVLKKIEQQKGIPFKSMEELRRSIENARV